MPSGPTPGISPAYTSLDRVRWLLGFPQSYTDQDVWLNDLIAGTSASFDSFLGFSFSIASKTEFFSGGINGKLALSYPAVSGGAITVTESGTALTSADFRASGQVLTRIDSQGQEINWLAGRENIEIGYLSGYASVPADIQRACSEETARAFRNANTGNGTGNRLGLVSSTPETGGSESFAPDAWSPTTQRTLASYGRFM